MSKSVLKSAYGNIAIEHDNQSIYKLYFTNEHVDFYDSSWKENRRLQTADEFPIVF